jgi:dTDP-4-dehydrorhamnose reductase
MADRARFRGTGYGGTRRRKRRTVEHLPGRETGRAARLIDRGVCYNVNRVGEARVGGRILITGGRGMLGRDLCAVFSATHTCMPVGRAEADITDYPAIADLIRRESPSLVIHAAAYTDVDGCERDPDTAYRVNAMGTWNVAAAARSCGARLVAVSTDFVFDGETDRPYTEFDAPRPINHYGASKLAGEKWAARACHETYIVRTQWLYGVHGRNFPYTILRAAAAGRPLRVARDEIGTPTYTLDLARKIAEIVEQPLYGIYHVGNAGSCSRYELACEVLRQAGVRPVSLEPIPAAEWPSPTRRPAYSVLRHYALELMGRDDLRPWQDALGDFVDAARGAGTLDEILG